MSSMIDIKKSKLEKANLKILKNLVKKIFSKVGTFEVGYDSFDYDDFYDQCNKFGKMYGLTDLNYSDYRFILGCIKDNEHCLTGGCDEDWELLIPTISKYSFESEYIEWIKTYKKFRDEILIYGDFDSVEVESFIQEIRSSGYYNFDEGDEIFYDITDSDFVDENILSIKKIK